MKGCWAWKDCDSCPFPKCYESNPGMVSKFWDKQEAFRLQAQGLKLKEIVATLHRSKRTIGRYLKERG